jgi:PleD family two-component response regulator
MKHWPETSDTVRGNSYGTPQTDLLLERCRIDGYGKRILVNDDDADCRALVEAQLEQEGYAVQTACDGVAGLDEVR